MPRYHTNSKEVLRDGRHFADCIDDGAARLIAEALNERKGMPRNETQPALPLDGADGPLFAAPQPGDKFTVEVDGRLYEGVYGAMPFTCRYPQIRQENDEYACSCGARWDASEGEEHP